MTGIKLAYYRKEDWKRFIKISDDRDSMHSSWKEWHKAFIKLKKDFILQGFQVKVVEIDLDELIIYCQIKGVKNDGRTRSQFVQGK